MKNIIYLFQFIFLALVTQLLLPTADLGAAENAQTTDHDLGHPSVLDPDVSELLMRTAKLVPDKVIQSKGRADQVSVKLILKRNGLNVPIPGLDFSISPEGSRHQTNAQGEFVFTCQSISVKVFEAALKAEHFSVITGWRSYRLSFEAKCGEKIQVFFDEAGPNGQAMAIYETLVRAREKLKNSVGLDFWKKQIKVVWPANADYYSFGRVHVTNGHHWDVVGHELGHAIYDQANIGAFGAGQHRIDQCYTETLALSEGWASFFSAWLFIDLDDADAKFQYMVPRRAPLRIEHVPQDVCEGPKNEWRTTAFFWDLVDLNNDSETTDYTFSEIWNATVNKRSKSMKDVVNELLQADFSRAELDEVWRLNFKTSM